MTLKGDANFKEKQTRGLKNDKRSLVNFHVGRRMSENLYFDGLRLSKADIKFQMKKHRKNSLKKN